MPYCPNCGTQVTQKAKFCNNCGNRLAPKPTQQFTPPPPLVDKPITQRVRTGEPIIAAISGLKKGILGRKSFMMLVSGQKLAFIQLTGNDIKGLNRQAKEQSKEKGDGFLGRMKAGLTASMKTGELFIGKEMNETLNRFASVMQVQSNNVNSLRIQSQGGEYTYYELQINAQGFNEKYRFDEYDKRDHEVLKGLLGERYSSSTWFL